MPEAQEEIQQLLDEIVKNGEEDGLQVAAYLHGKLVINAFAGMADPPARKAVDASTLFIGMSTSKVVTATVIHRLAQAGKLDYDDKVSTYWPEFAAHAKEMITIRQVLCHQAGIPQMPKHANVDMVSSWDTMIKEIEQLQPLWVPGTKTGYHGLTFGWILGEVAQRIDGRSFAQIVAEDISQPLGLADELFFGAPPEIETRIAKIFHRKRLFVYLPIIRELPIFRPFNQAVPPRLVPIGGDPHWDQSRFQRAVIPAGNAVMTAHALARIHAALIGEVDGVRLLSPDQLKLATTLQTSEPDKILMGQAVPKALGYWLGNNPGAPALGNDRHVFGHTGLGGMIGFADPIQDFTFALVKNRLTFRDTKDTDVRVANAVRNALGLSGMIHAGQPV